MPAMKNREQKRQFQLNATSMDRTSIDRANAIITPAKGVTMYAVTLPVMIPKATVICGSGMTTYARIFPNRTISHRLRCTGHKDGKCMFAGH
jgi:hypothetical protein